MQTSSTTRTSVRNDSITLTSTTSTIGTLSMTHEVSVGNSENSRTNEVHEAGISLSAPISDRFVSKKDQKLTEKIGQVELTSADLVDPNKEKLRHAQQNNCKIKIKIGTYNIQSFINGISDPDNESFFKHLEVIISGSIDNNNVGEIQELLNLIASKAKLLLMDFSFENLHEDVRTLDKLQLSPALEELLSEKCNDNGHDTRIAKFLNKIGVFCKDLKGEENLHKSLIYLKESLRMYQNLLSSNNPQIMWLLNDIAIIYETLGGEENIRMGLKYLKKSIGSQEYSREKVKKLNALGLSYAKLGGEENLKKGLKFHEKCLEMLFQELSSLDRDNPMFDYIVALLVPDIQEKLKYYKELLRMYQQSHSNNVFYITDLLYKIGVYYLRLGNEECNQIGLSCFEEALEICRREQSTDNQAILASTLINMAGHYEVHHEITGERENLRKKLMCLEQALKIHLQLYSDNHLEIALSLNKVGFMYYRLGDLYKAQEYFKQSCSIFLKVNDTHELIARIKSNIEVLHADFFQSLGQRQSLPQNSFGGNVVGFECRWIILSRGETNDDLVLLKQKIQQSILPKIVEVVNTTGWSYVNFLSIDWGVKGYIEKNYLARQLEELGSSNENVELVQMLCFESMNLSIMKSEKKQYELVESFTREYPELIKKIAKEHPEFFVDGSIVEACIRAMPDQESKEYILDHVKYMGMEKREEKIQHFENSEWTLL